MHLKRFLRTKLHQICTLLTIGILQLWSSTICNIEQSDEVLNLIQITIKLDLDYIKLLVIYSEIQIKAMIWNGSNLHMMSYILWFMPCHIIKDEFAKIMEDLSYGLSWAK